MSDSLGLSIGTANLVAARTGSAPMTRSSALTLFDHRPPELGAPEENPGLNEPGLVLSGFVERVGDADPLIAPDGSAHSSEALTAAALDAMARAAGYGTPLAVAVPGHWTERQVAALRTAVRGYPALAPDAAPPAFICDGTAALAALYAQPGFPHDGAVVLCDFGASGSSITLTDAAANFRQIAPTLRCTGFSGNQLDQTILRHVAADFGADAVGTAPLAPLGRRLAQCRSAKEQLSAATVSVIPADLPGIGADVRLTRGEFEGLISEPLQRFVACVAEMLQSNRIRPAGLAAIASVGGGACIPLITSRLSEGLQAPVVTTSQPRLSAAIGAAVLAQLRSSPAAPAPVGVARDTQAAPAALTEGVAATEMAPSAWAARSAPGQSAANGDRSATYRALAWSQEASSGELPITAVGGEVGSEDYGVADAVPAAGAGLPDERPPRRPPRWYRRSAVLISATGAAALVLLVGAGLAVRLGGTENKPTDHMRNVTPPVESSRLEPPPPAPATSAVVSPTPEPTESPPQPATTVVTTTAPPVTTTTPPTTYPTNTTPSTTYPTTTYPTTTYPTTTYPVTPYPTVSKSVAPTFPSYPATRVPVTPH